MRTKIIAGNWKMNLTRQDAALLLGELSAILSGRPRPPAEVVVCPPFTLLETVGSTAGRLWPFAGRTGCVLEGKRRVHGADFRRDAA